MSDACLISLLFELLVGPKKRTARTLLYTAREIQEESVASPVASRKIPVIHLIAYENNVGREQAKVSVLVKVGYMFSG